MSTIWGEIIRAILKSDKRAVRVRFETTSMISDQIQVPLYYSHFEIAEFSGQYQYLFDQVAGLLKSGNKKTFTSHFEITGITSDVEMDIINRQILHNLGCFSLSVIFNNIDWLAQLFEYPRH